MRIRLMMTSIAVAAGLLGLSLAGTSRAGADFPYVETVEIVPVRSIVDLPSYYVTTSDVRARSAIIPTSSTIYGLAPTSVYLPTTTYIPTSTYIPTTTYFPTSTYIPTTTYAYPTRYAYRPFRPRRFLERIYVTEAAYLTPTYFVRPTTVVRGGLVASSMVCCETATPMVQTVVPQTPVRRPTEAMPERPGSSITSKVAGDADSAVDAARTNRDAEVNTAGGAGSRTALPGVGTGDAEREAKKPVVPVTPTKEVVKEQIPAAPRPAAPVGVKPVTPATGGAAADPKKDILVPTGPTPPAPTQPEEPPPLGPGAVPSPVDTLPLPKAGDTTRRDAMRPPFPTGTVRPMNLKNVLQGQIVSADSKIPEEGVEVMLTDRRNPTVFKTARSNAFGQFAVTLPEGEWAINIQMPSGRTLAVDRGTVTAGAGKVVDMYGRELPNLVISR